MKKPYGLHKTKSAGMSLSELGQFFAGSVGYARQRPGTPYSQVVCVYACIQARANAISRLQLTVADDQDNIIESGPLVEMIYQPNPKRTGRAFWRATSAYLDLFGVAYWRKTYLGNQVAQMEVHGAHEIQRIETGFGDVAGYRFTPSGSGTSIILTPEEVHEVYDPDYESADTDRPLSPRQAVSMAVAQYYKGDLANETSLDNDVQPGGLLAYKDGITEEQKAQVQREVTNRHGGAANRRRLMILAGNVEWQSIQAAFAEMEFSELKKMSRTDICAGYSTPPAVIGYYEESNYAHAEAAQEVFWENTILPRAAWLAEEWDMAVTRSYEGDMSMAAAKALRRPVSAAIRRSAYFRQSAARARGTGRRIYAYFDASMIQAVQRGQLKLATTAKEWTTMGVPLNDIIRAYDLPFAENKWGDTWHKPIGLVDVQEESTPWADDPAGPTEPEPQGAVPDDDAAPGDDQPPDGVKAADLDRLWESWRASWAGLEKAIASRVSAHFYELRAQTLRRLDETTQGKSIEPAEKRDIIGRILFNLYEANKMLLVKVGALLRDAHRLGGEQSMQEAAEAKGDTGPANPYNIADPAAVRLIRQREIRITETNNTLRRNLSESLAQGVDAGETTAQLAERIRSQFNIAGNRATTIARTEVGGAVEEARQLGREQAKVPMKSWLWSRKETGRAWHQAIERQTMDKPIPNNDVFVSGKTGSTAMQPRGFGVPVEDINCGCTALARFPGDQVKDVIGRLHKRGFLTYEQLVQRSMKGSQNG